MILTSCSVVVLVVDQLDVGLVESERDPPVATDPDRPVAGKVTLERVCSKRRDREVVRALRHVEEREDAQQLRDMRRLDTLLRPTAIQTLQALVAEAHDHLCSVSCIATRYAHAAWNSS